MPMIFLMFGFHDFSLYFIYVCLFAFLGVCLLFCFVFNKLFHWWKYFCGAIRKSAEGELKVLNKEKKFRFVVILEAKREKGSGETALSYSNLYNYKNPNLQELSAHNSYVPSS